MIVGIGTDIVKVARVKKIFYRYRLKFAKKILQTKEYNYFLSLDDIDRVGYLAKRFAAKEAAAKALGCGIGISAGFRDIEVVTLSSGKPTLIFENKADDTAKNLGVKSANISLSDERDFAIAFVVLSS